MRQLQFIKKSEKFKSLDFTIDTKLIVSFKNPPHGVDLYILYFVTERAFAIDGFLNLVFKGYNPEATLLILHGPPLTKSAYPTKVWIVEALVEAMQKCVAGNNFTFTDFFSFYQQACQFRAVAVHMISEAHFRLATTLLQNLNQRWSELPSDGQILLEFT